MTEEAQQLYVSPIQVLWLGLTCMLQIGFVFCTCKKVCLQCFDAVGWAAGRASSL